MAATEIISPTTGTSRIEVTYVPALDGLRGLAILLVMTFHFVQGIEVSSLFGRAGMVLLNAGWCGVDLFFVLSGYLITGILFDARGTQRYFRNFYMRRFLRIFPLYYGVLFLIFFVMPHFIPSGPAEQRIYDRQGWLWLYASNIAMSLDGAMFFHAGWLSLNHFWSLAVEEHFYLLWPALVGRLERRTLMWVCLALVVAAPLLRLGLILSGASWVAAYTLTPCRMDGLALGGLLALAVRGEGGIAELMPRARWGLILAGAALMGMFVARGGLSISDRLVGTAGFSLLALFFGALLVQVLGSRSRPLKAFFTHPILRFFGRYSYALYVFHQILRPLMERVMPLEQLSALCGSTTGGAGLYVMSALTLCSGLAWLSWHLYEKHFLKLKRYFEYRRTKEAELTAASGGMKRPTSNVAS